MKDRVCLTSKEEFMDLQRRIGISDMGLEGHNISVGTSKIDESKSSIDLFSGKMYELDKEPQVNIHNKRQKSDNRIF